MAYGYAFQLCRHVEATPEGSKMLCRMPVVSLPDDLSEQLNQSESGTINNTQGPGVAVYESSDGRTRADIYIGLKLDGFILYQNISSVHSNIKMQFSLKPVVFCMQDDVSFNPSKDIIIAIKVNRCFQSLLFVPSETKTEFLC